MAIQFHALWLDDERQRQRHRRGHTVDIDENFFDIVEKSDSLMALMGYFEARKGRLGLFTDVVWEDLTFDAHRSTDINRSVSGNPFARLPDFNVTIKGNLNIKAMPNSIINRQSSNPAPPTRSPSGERVPRRIQLWTY